MLHPLLDACHWFNHLCLRIYKYVQFKPWIVFHWNNALILLRCTLKIVVQSTFIRYHFLHPVMLRNCTTFWQKTNLVSLYSQPFLIHLVNEVEFFLACVWHTNSCWVNIDACTLHTCRLPHICVQRWRKTMVRVSGARQWGSEESEREHKGMQTHWAFAPAYKHIAKVCLKANAARPVIRSIFESSRERALAFGNIRSWKHTHTQTHTCSSFFYFVCVCMCECVPCRALCKFWGAGVLWLCLVGWGEHSHMLRSAFRHSAAHQPTPHLTHVRHIVMVPSRVNTPNQFSTFVRRACVMDYFPGQRLYVALVRPELKCVGLYI